MNKSLLNKVIRKFFMDVYAEDNPTPPNTTPPAQVVDVEALIQKVRKEEKDKLYPEIEGLKTKVKNLEADLAAKNKEVRELNDQIKNADTNNDASKQELQKKIDQLEAEITTLKDKKQKSATENEEKLQKQVDDLIARLDKQERDSEEAAKKMKLEMFKKDKIAEAKGELIEELVKGETEEEITASIETAKTKYKEIVEKVGGNQTNQQRISNVNPIIDPKALGDKTPEEIRKMTPKEYSEYRKTVGIGQSGRKR